MNGILMATRTGVAPVRNPLSPRVHRHAGARTDSAASDKAGNRAIQALRTLLRHVFRSSWAIPQAAANTDAGIGPTGSGRGLALALGQPGDGDAEQDCAIAKQDPDIASASHARRLSSIAGIPPGNAIEGTAVSIAALPSQLQNPTATGRAAGWRWWRALSRMWRGTTATETTEIRFVPPARPLPSLGFREFTAPRRLQGGGALRLRTKAPGRIAAFDGLQSKRGRQR